MAKAKAAKKAKPNPRNKKLYDDGMKMRKAVLGASYVDNSMANAATDDFMMSFQDITTEYAWGYVWTRPGLPKKTRSMLNLAMLAALNRGPELKLHVNGALNNGLTKEEIKLVESGDFEGIRKLLESKYPGQLNVPITRPFPITPPIRISGSFPITSPPDNGNDNDK